MNDNVQCVNNDYCFALTTSNTSFYPSASALKDSLKYLKLALKSVHVKTGTDFVFTCTDTGPLNYGLLSKLEGLKGSVSFLQSGPGVAFGELKLYIVW